MDWQGAELPFEIRNFGPATAADLSHVHCQDYVNGILDGEIANGHGNTNLRVSHSCLLTVGSFTAAAEEAVNNGIVACSPTSGFHHACYDSGRGFCTFNGLLAAAWKLLARDWSVAIVDCDAHFGDGTQNIIDHLMLHDKISHWTYGREIPAAFEWRSFEDQMDGFVESFLTQSNAGRRILFYQAGADVHVDDPLGPGELGMHDFEMRQRDQLLFKRGFPQTIC